MEIGVTRLEGRALLEALLARFTTIEPAGDLVRTEPSVIAGIHSTPLRLR